MLSIAVFSAAVWLTATQAGARWAFSSIEQRWPDRLVAQGISGTLIGPMQFDQLTVNSQGMRIELTQGKLDWAAKALFNRRFHLQYISVQRATVTLHKKENEPQSAPSKVPNLPSASSPISVRVDQALIAELDIQRDHPSATRLTLLEISGQLEKNQLSIDGFSGQWGEFAAFLEGDLALEENGGVDLHATLNQVERTGAIRLKLQGPSNEYAWQLRSTLEVDGLPDYKLNTSGHGDLQGLSVSAGQIETLEGQIHPLGELVWWPAISSDLRFKAEEINPETLVSELPGKIALEGEINYHDKQLAARITGNGTLRDYPVGLATMGHWNAGKLVINTAQGVVGDNRISLSGNLHRDQSYSLFYTVNANHLDKLYPGLSGTLNGDGRVTGTMEAANIQTSLQANQMQWQAHQLGELKLNIQPRKHGNHALDLKASDLRSASRQLDSLSISGDISPSRQSLKLSALSENQHAISTHIETVVGERFEKIEGTINNTRLNVNQRFSLQQTEATRFHANEQEFILEKLCLGPTNQPLCIEAERVQRQSKLEVKALDFPLRLLSHWLPQAEQLKEKLNATALITGDAQGWTLSSSLDIDKQNRLEAQGHFNTGNKGLSGNASVQFDKLQWLALLSPNIVPPEGQLTGAISLTGNLDAPQLKGQLALENGLLRLPSSGTELSDIQLDVQLPKAQQSAIIQGSLKAGDGAMSLNGTAQWNAPGNPSLTLQATGDHLLVMDTHEARVHVSPRLKLDATPKRVHVSGELGLPEAHFTLGEIPASAARVSSDETIISRKGEQSSRGGIPLEAIIDLKIGNVDDQKVILEGFGLYSELRGQIRISQIDGKAAQGDGNVRITEGHYKAFGQDLSIERGEIFFNGPLDNPGYSIQAIRRTGDIRAGIRLSGTLEQPSSSLFSDPPLSDTDTLSYLLTGQAFNREGSSDAEADALLLMAATRWGLKAGGGILENLQAKSGFDTLRISADDDLNQSALLVGKYLTPKLYLQYAIRLFEETDIFSLRYQLTPSLQLEAESGTSQGLDLIYQLERD